MLKFLIKALTWLLPGTVVCYAVWWGLVQANPSRDSLGLYRMMPSTCNSMIFGTSRSGQGVNPAVLEALAPSSGKWLNFSFNLGASSWNPAYARAIQEKVDCSIQVNSALTFFFFIDPWALDEKTGAGSGAWFEDEWSDVCEMDALTFAKHKTNPLDVLGFGSGSDFLSVFASAVPRQLIARFTGDLDYFESRGLQHNGWLPNNGQLSLDEKRAAIKAKVDHYRRNNPIGLTWPARTNLACIERCIEFIAEKRRNSRIFLIRPPTSDEMRLLEDEWFPTADFTFRELAISHGVTYVDAHCEWTERNILHFNDGHHMCVDGAHSFSEFLAINVVLKSTFD